MVLLFAVEYITFHEPRLGTAYLYHFPTGGIFELTEEEYARMPDPELLDQIRHYSGPRFSLSHFLSHLAAIGAEIDGLSFPAHVEIEITLRCNLRCIHCYAGSSERAPEGASTDQWIRLIRSLDHTVLLGVTGGEPLLREDIFEILSAAKDRGLVVKLLTNGILLPSRLDDLLDVLEPGIDIIHISLDGDKRAHEAIRGPNTFGPALKAVKMASEHFPVEVAFTLLPQNMDAVEKAYVIAADAGASLFQLGLVQPIGRGARYTLPFSALRDALDRLRPLVEKYGVPVSSEFMEDGVRQPPASFYSCPAGISYAFVAHNGDVYPCQAFRPHFRMGNAFEVPLYTLWKRFDAKQLRRNVLGTKCASCPLFSSCRAGCPGVTYRFKKTLNSPDPLCDL